MGVRAGVRAAGRRRRGRALGDGAGHRDAATGARRRKQRDDGRRHRDRNPSDSDGHGGHECDGHGGHECDGHGGIDECDGHGAATRAGRKSGHERGAAGRDSPHGGAVERADGTRERDGRSRVRGGPDAGRRRPASRVGRSGRVWRADRGRARRRARPRRRGRRGRRPLSSSVQRAGYHQVRIDQDGKHTQYVIEVRAGKTTRVKSSPLP